MKTKQNAKINNISTVEFYTEDAGEFLHKHKNVKEVDIVIVDPPRKGLSEVFINTLINVKPSKIVYVSCDPATLARDLKILSPFYEIKVIESLDMFPRTAHVETITLLSLKTA